MRLPAPASSSAERTSAGTITFSRRGRSPRRSANRRSPPAQAASTTSLGLTPKRRRAARRSSSERDTRTWRRAAAPAALSDEPGAGGSRVCAIVRASPGRSRIRPGVVASRAGVSASRAPSAARSSAPRASRARGDGSGAGARHPGSAGGSASGAASRIRRPSSAMAAPSTMQWCILPISATRSSGSSSAIHICHSGRSRGSGVERIPSTIASRSAPSAWSRCSAGSKRGSSAQTGSWSPSGTGASFWR